MSTGTIWRCWLALMLLLAATTASAFVPLGNFNLPVSLAIAVTKALVVLLFFMERRGSKALVIAAAEQVRCRGVSRPLGFYPKPAIRGPNPKP